eukprot:1379701-Rhodomonas_salina.1
MALQGPGPRRNFSPSPHSNGDTAGTLPSAEHGGRPPARGQAVPSHRQTGYQARYHRWPQRCARSTRRGVRRGAVVGGPAAPPPSDSKRTARPVRRCVPSSSVGRPRAGGSQSTR